jgi:hypothetical protein
MPRNLSIFASLCAVLICAAVCAAQDFSVPESATAGEEASISTRGNGKATFYLVGPGVSNKSDVALGEAIQLHAKDLRNAGEYLAIVCSDSCHSAPFYVSPAKPATLTFLVHPSRVPVGQNDAVSGVAFPFDQYRNLVLAPLTVNFQIMAGTTSLFSRPEKTRGGVAWFRTASGRSAGAVQITASIDDVIARRALQQVASEPCNLRIDGKRVSNGIVVQTLPVHDCAGNVVPDGTIVTFSASEAQGKSTVDAPIKQGIAKAQIDAAGSTVISAASGVVLGNELRIGAK